ncbi:MAG: hypothetical protein AUJ28_00955 [Parcubacteria group bacterium CG1_02_37_51]|uniref:Uncharacterized protein n=2 Tax=Candidatus Komeiliibacteriota TaxID=1817908 RepID=A0A2M8DRR9_9BACT|nr:MAG: hypothetical protein AUJ28_00955 [Parcubacteria group bacterium CG1_02_37_51]PIY94743.1 MAG: hypothetical protein COY67_02185 [Candidatus Komeilibacteria bacterium CG_4_10_14_0_8_um_filter_37_78]PJC02067.1 MAG: hypothetical protein CO073_01420 [Candidatus Komeilibacteria bacterium CG_4_9_14_0_8_um_filter_36_9]
MPQDIRFQRPEQKQIQRPSLAPKLLDNTKKVIIWLVILIILALIISFFVNKIRNVDTANQYLLSDGWQAVFLNNDQTYFGKITTINDEVVVLESVYYLQDQKDLQAGPQPKEGELALVKLGSEVHGPNNLMIIPKTSITFIENLKDTSAIVRAIEKNN